MRSAKVGLATRTVANAAAALRTVPAGRNQRTFLCVHYYRARIPDGTAMQDSMRWCAALRRPTCFELVCACEFHECGGIRPVRVSAEFATQRVRSKVESLRALHQYTNVQRRSALHTTPATLVARPAPVESLHSWSHCGRFVVHERRSLRPLTLRCACNSACDGRVAAPVCMPMQWKTRGNHRSVSARTVRCTAAVEVEVCGSPVP